MIGIKEDFKVKTSSGPVQSYIPSAINTQMNEGIFSLRLLMIASALKHCLNKAEKIADFGF